MQARQLFLVGAILALSLALAVGDDYWVAPMRQVHSNFSGNVGAVARFGDSITYSAAFYKPLQWDFTNKSPADTAALDWIHRDMYQPAWSWQDDAVAYSNGNYSGTTSSWPLQLEQGPPKTNIDFWLDKLRPETAVIMWGTNDLSGGVSVANYTNNMRQVLQACKTHGTVPILTTIPPRRGFNTQSATYAQAMRDLAIEQQVPLIDYNQEILTRRPTDWDGSLISSDGVHPSWGGADASNFSQTALNNYGYTLRNWMTLNTLYNVYQQVLVYDRPQPAGIRVYDVASSDVPGPQPIHAFPVPAAAAWPRAKLLFDNYAAGIGFSASDNPATWAWSSMPLSNADVTIHGLTNDKTSPVIDDSYQLYGSVEESGYDNRFPTHVPRLARYHGQNYAAFDFELAAPTTKFGVYLPASSNSYGSGAGQYFHDQNGVPQTRSVWVIFEDESGTVTREYVPLTVMGSGTYCPFLTITWNGVDRITKVKIVHDVAENTTMGVGFMDVYSAGATHAGDATGDDHVNVDDLGILASNYDGTNKGWGKADFTGDRTVNVDDLGVLASNYDWVAPGAQSIPEPASLLLLTCAAAALLRRQRQAQS